MLVILHAIVIDFTTERRCIHIAELSQAQPAFHKQEYYKLLLLVVITTLALQRQNRFAVDVFFMGRF